MKLAFISWFVISSTLLLEKVNGDDECGTIDCVDCIESGCAWAVGQCLESCSMIADAPCYSSTYSTDPATEICQRKDDDEADSAACFSQTDCGGCVQTLKSDGSYCQWYAEDSFGSPHPSPYCSTGGCDMVGCGSSVCPQVDNSMVDETIITSTSTLDCSVATECSDCLNGNCSWSPEAGCFDSCDFIADASCFSPGGITDTVQEVCDRIDANEQNQELCSQPEDCTSCIDTIQSDGTTCKWYTDYPDGTSLGDPYCGTGACNMDGVCGSDTCTAPATTISTTSGANGGSIQCFASKNQVNILQGPSGTTMKPIKDLRIGDFVQVEHGEYSRVYSFAHLDSSRKSSFLQIYLDNLKSPLEVTPEHLLFAKSSGGKTVESKAASLIKLGDELLLPSGGTSTVTKISNTIRNDGIYAPLTEKGTIAVSGVLASCYVALPSSHKFSASFHWLSHTATLPRRWYCRFNWKSCQNESYTSDGLATWASLMWILAEPILESGIETVLLTTAVLSILMTKVIMVVKQRKAAA